MSSARLIKGFISFPIVFLWLLVNCSQQKPKPNHSSLALDSLLNISSQLITNQQYDSGRIMLQSLLKSTVSDKQSGSIARIWYNLALIDYYQNDIDEGIEHVSKANRLFAQSGDDKRSARGKQLLGLFLNLKGLNQRAISTYFEALALAKTSSDSANLHITIGNIYLETEAYQSSIQQYLKASYLLDKVENSPSRNLLLNNLGLAYLHLNLFDSSKHYLKRAIDLNRKNGQLRIAPFNNLGLTYNKEQNPDSALFYLQGALRLVNDHTKPSSKITTYTQLGEAYRQKSNHPLALRHLNEGLKLLKTEEKLDVHAEHYKYQKLLALHNQQYFRALQWDTKLDSVNNIIFDKQKLSIQKIAADFELEQANSRTQKAILQQQQEEQRSTTRLYFVALLGIIVFLLSLLIIYIIKQRSQLTALNQELAKKNELISTINTQNLHFSKNSLAESASLIAMKIRQIEDPDVKSVLLAEQTRNLTVNNLFQTLFLQADQQNAQEVELSNLIKKVVDDTIDAALPIDHNVQVLYNLDRCLTSSKVALPISLITNEVALNSCKYAFVNHSGKFKVDLSANQNQLRLTIGDDGPGTSGLSKQDSNTSFGHKMIRSLCQELDAKLDVSDTESGLSYYFTIPIQNSNGRH